MVLSLKWKIQLLYAVILALLLGTLGTTYYFNERAIRFARVDVELDAMQTPLLGGVVAPGGPPPGGRGGPPHPGHLFPDNGPAAELPGWTLRSDSSEKNVVVRGAHEAARIFNPDLVKKGYYGAVISRWDGDYLLRSDNFPDLDLPDAEHGNYARTREGRFREQIHFGRRYNFVVGVELTDFFESLRTLAVQLVGLGVLLFLLVMTLGYVLVSRCLRPLTSISRSVTEVSNGHLAERISEENKGHAREFDLLVEELNHSFAQLDRLFTRQARFTADASHELKTPLTILTAQVDLALSKDRSVEELKAFFERCSASCKRLKTVIERLLEMARFDAGRVRLEAEMLPLDEYLEELCGEMSLLVEDKGSRLLTDFNTSNACFDPFRLQQVLFNLVSNALQHNEPPVTIRIASSVQEDRAVIEVADDGKGIRPESLECLFDRFFQENESRNNSGKTDSCGLGLSISKAIVELHGGTLSVRSDPGRETVFTISLPMGTYQSHR